MLGPGGAVERVDRAGDGAATLAGWACDPEWPGASVAVAIHAGAPREQPGSTLLGIVRADEALASPLSLEVSAACDGPRRPAARHGFAFAPPAGSAGPFFVYALDAATTDGPAAPPTLLRNGIVDLETSAAGGTPRATVTTGWIEAPASGSYTFWSGLAPSRLFVNGRKLVDWWTGAGPIEGSIDLVAGGKYHVRWDRFDPAPSPPDAAIGLTWRAPGSAAQAPIPSSLLYRLAPGRGQGLAAAYFDNPGFSGAAVERLDPVIDVGTAWPAATRLPAGIAASEFSAVWQGEIVADYSDSYRFVVTTAGRAELSIAGQALLPPEQLAPPLAPACRHDICALGDKLAASTSHQPACHPCVDQICARDPFCCNGGYRSYYATEPEWDAKCVTEVNAVCGLACTNPLPSPTTRQRTTAPVQLEAGVRYAIRLAVDNGSADVTTQLAWVSARQAREVVPARALFAPAAGAEAAGAGLNVVVFARGPAGSTAPPDLDEPLGAGATPDLSLRPPAGATGLPLVDVIASSDGAGAGVPPPPAVVSPRHGARVFQPAPQVLLTVLGGVTGGALRARVPADGGWPRRRRRPAVRCRRQPDRRRGSAGKLRRAHAAAIAANEFGRRERGGELGRDRRRAGARVTATAGDVGAARSDLHARRHGEHVPRQRARLAGAGADLRSGRRRPVGRDRAFTASGRRRDDLGQRDSDRGDARGSQPGLAQAGAVAGRVRHHQQTCLRQRRHPPADRRVPAFGRRPSTAAPRTLARSSRAGPSRTRRPASAGWSSPRSSGAWRSG